MKRIKAIIAIIVLGGALSLPLGVEPVTDIKRAVDPISSRIEDSSNSDSSTLIISSSSASSNIVETPIEPEDPTEPIEPTEPDGKEPIFTDFQTFIDWFARVVIPWLVAFFTTGGAGVLIFQIAKFLANQYNTNRVVGQATDELNSMRSKYSETLKSITARDELLKALIDSQINAQVKTELQAKYDALPSVAELETSKVTVKVRVKKSKKKTEEVISDETISK